MDVLMDILGRFHPTITHLPIGFMVLCVLLFLKDRKKKEYTVLLTTLVLWTGIAGALACITGYLLYWSDGYSYMTVRSHLWLGIITTIFCFLVYGRWKSGIHSDLRNIPLGLFLGLGLILITLTGHKGGNLSRGSDYLVQPLPMELKKMLGFQVTEKLQVTLTSENWEASDVYADLVNPILNNKCVSCHGPEKSKGGLRLDSKEGILAGGENGPVVRLHDLENSELISRVELPEYEEGHMPPEGKEPLSKSEIKLLKAWIEKGHPFDGTIGSLAFEPSTIEPFIFRDAAGLYPKDTLPVASEIQKDNIRKAGLYVESLSTDTSWLVVSALNKPDFSVSDTLLLNPIIQNIVELDLSHTQIDDSVYSYLSKISNLTVLNLSHTAVTDNNIEQLAKLKYLKRLNLTFTSVSDSLISKLEDLTGLNTVYLFGTAIIPDSILLPSGTNLNLEFGGYELPVLERDSIIY